MHKISLILLLTIFTVTAFGASESEIQKKSIEKTIEADAVFNLLRQCNSKIYNGRRTGKPLATIRYFMYNTIIKKWLKYRWFVADTGLSKKWLKSVQDLILYMQKTQDYIYIAKYNRDTKNAKYKQAVKYLDITYKRFVKLLKKPVKVSSKLQRKAQIKKEMWQRMMRKKYK